jgi:DNA primase
MGLLELVQKHVEMRKVGGEWHGPCPACGTSQSDPAFSDRFTVKADDRWFCRNCGNGDSVAFLRKFENMNCPDAHAAAGKTCTSTTCQVSDKCRMGNGIAPPKKNIAATPGPCAAKRLPAAFTPGVAKTPAELWQAKAEELVTAAHEALLECPEQLAYLAGRGLPLEAVIKYRLGWNAKVIWKSRESWGLPEKISKKTNKPTKLWVPRGIIIPTYVDGIVHRVRVRVPDEDRNSDVPGYVAVSGSGDDVIVLNPEVRAFVVVEADLCALLIDWLAGDLVGAIPLVSCDVKPKSKAAALLEKALAILVATDFDPRANTTSGSYENPGGKAARWWLRNYPRAKRWPVPVGKDPGDALAGGVDIRAWIMEGLPPAVTMVVRGTSYFHQVYEKVMNMEYQTTSFDHSKALQLISDANSIVATRCPVGAMEWILNHRPAIAGHLKEAEKAVDSAFEAENEEKLIKNLDAWKRYNFRAFDVFEGRPPVIEVQSQLFDEKVGA